MTNTEPVTIRVVSARVEFVRRAFLRPLRLSSGVISEVTEARAAVTVTTSNKREATGRGAIYLSDLWAWPDPNRTPDERDAAMRAYTERLASEIVERTGSTEAAAHPLALGLRLHDSAERDNDLPLPTLARLVCAAPLDAALHDAAGKAFSRSAFALYDGVEPAPIPGADSYFADGVMASVQRMLGATAAENAATRLDATLVVGKGDDLAELTEWVTEKRYRAFKLKIGGTDAREDAERVSSVYRWAVAAGASAPRLTVDSNCASPNAETVAAFLTTLRNNDGEAYDALEAVEQPTGRDIHANAFDWREIAAQKPLLLDEGLTGFADLECAARQGWNGMAVKTCRGHSFSLAAAAWAWERGWTLAMMDLTNPGYAAIHSALLASRLPGVSAIEMNAPQYTPEANREFLPRLASLLAPNDGQHHLPRPVPVGLGSGL